MTHQEGVKWYAGSELEAMRAASNYRDWILGHFAPYLGAEVVEVGAGSGTFAEALLARFDLSALVLVEPAENLVPLLQERFARDARVRVVRGPEELAPDTRVDSVVSVNVLEHVADDEALLATMGRLLRPGGTLLLLVPALPWLYGTLDRSFGHVRRYTRASLVTKLMRAGFVIVRVRYMNLPGVIGWALAGKVLRRVTLKPGDVRAYDRWIVPWASRLERYWEWPLGQSLIAVAGR